MTYDFINEIMKDFSELEILGDGSQTKSYLLVNDCIRAMLLGLEKSNRQVNMLMLDLKTKTSENHS